MKTIGRYFSFCNLRRIAWNVLLLYVAYTLCRCAFLLDNSDMFADTFSWQRICKMFFGGFLFDSSAIVFTNALWLFLVLFPLHKKERQWWGVMLKWLFIAVNAVCIASNLIDGMYFPFGLQRATALTFTEFGGENNLVKIAAVELLRHWYLLLLFAGLLFMLVKGYRKVVAIPVTDCRKYYVTQIVTLVVIAPLAIGGMRGGFTTAIRPITISNAHQYVEKPIETGIVLNTPFSIIKTISHSSVKVPKFYGSQEELDEVFSPVHLPNDSVAWQPRNVVILIVESFAKEFVGGLNTHLDDGQYKGYTEFVDSLLPHCMYWEESFANGSISIDAMPSILASLPKMKQSYVLSPYSLDEISGIASILRGEGYATGFFHGAENSSMGFQAFARAAGFENYYGRTEYNRCKAFGGDKDFDGTWAIWDEPFLQYFCHELNGMREPFCASVFTASSHHPFALPDKYKNVYKEEGKHKLHKCIRYTDNALRLFFEEAKRQPWYKNTLFVLTADHASSKTTHEEYQVELGHFKVPILFFDPNGQLPVGPQEGVAQQIDIMPTVLGILGYGKPYVAFGKNLMSDRRWAFNWNNVPQYISGDLMLELDNEGNAKGLYRYRTDRTLKQNIKETLHEQDSMEREAKAIMQSCLSRMADNRLTIGK